MIEASTFSAGTLVRLVPPGSLDSLHEDPVCVVIRVVDNCESSARFNMHQILHDGRLVVVPGDYLRRVTVDE